MPYPYGDTITIHTKSGTTQDPVYGNDVPTYTDSAVVGGFAPAGSVEIQQGRETITTTPTLYLPAGTSVAALDRVTVRGVTYEVNGTPQDWRHPMTGWQAGIVVRLQNVTG